MRCYFHLAHAHQVIPDHDGVEVSDPEEARTFAREVALEMLQSGEAQASDWQGWRLDVADASGTALVTIPLDALLS